MSERNLVTQAVEKRIRDSVDKLVRQIFEQASEGPDAAERKVQSMVGAALREVGEAVQSGSGDEMGVRFTAAAAMMQSAATVVLLEHVERCEDCQKEIEAEGRTSH